MGARADVPLATATWRREVVFRMIHRACRFIIRVRSMPHYANAACRHTPNDTTVAVCTATHDHS